MNDDKTKELVKVFENKVHDDLFGFLQKKGKIDAHVPQCPDVEEKWTAIARAYLPDGAREFQKYPVVSLGWMMFVGMALARYWDTDWTTYASRTDLYEQLRDKRGYDCLDEEVIESVLSLKEDEAQELSDLVAECASRVFNLLRHEEVEPGTQAAFGCYVAALHELYLAGMAMELNRLGYHMTPLNVGSN